MFCSSVEQAENELSHDWTLMRSGNHGVPTTIEWLNDVLPSGCRVGIDPVSFCFLLCYIHVYTNYHQIILRNDNFTSMLYAMPIDDAM
jgi:hypothetical protein